MKAVLLKALRVNGVAVARAPEGPTVIDLDEAEFESLADRGVVRAADKFDLALVVGDAEIVEETPAPVKAEKPARARRAEVEAPADAPEDL